MSSRVWTGYSIDEARPGTPCQSGHEIRTRREPDDVPSGCSDRALRHGETQIFLVPPMPVAYRVSSKASAAALRRHPQKEPQSFLHGDPLAIPEWRWIDRRSFALTNHKMGRDGKGESSPSKSAKTEPRCRDRSARARPRCRTWGLSLHTIRRNPILLIVPGTRLGRAHAGFWTRTLDGDIRAFLYGLFVMGTGERRQARNPRASAIGERTARRSFRYPVQFGRG